MPPIDVDAAISIISEHPVFRRGAYVLSDASEGAKRYVLNFLYSIPSLSFFFSRTQYRINYFAGQLEDACVDLYEALHGKLLMDLRENITAANYPDNRGYDAAQRNYFHDRNNLNVAEETYRIAIQRIFLLSQMILNRTTYKLPTPNDGILFLAELFCSHDPGYEMNTDEINDSDLAVRVAQLCGHQRVQNEDGSTSFPTSEELPIVNYNQNTGNIARYAEDRRQALVTSGPSARLSHGERIREGPPFDVHHYEPGEVFPGTPAEQAHRAAHALSRIADQDVRSSIPLEVRQRLAEEHQGRLNEFQRNQTQSAANALLNLRNKRGRVDEDDGNRNKVMRQTHDEEDIDGGKRRRKTSKKSKANKKRRTVKKRKIVKKRKTVRRR